MPQLAVPQPKKFVYLKSILPDMRCQFITFLIEEAHRAAAGRAAPKKVCVPNIGLPDMHCQLITFLVAEADRAATGRAAAEKLCVCT